MAVAQADTTVVCLHDQLTLVGARDESRDGDREPLRNGRHEIDAGPFLDDREARAVSNDPDIRSEPLAATLTFTWSAHRRAALVTPLV